MGSDFSGRFAAALLAVGLALSSMINIHHSPQTVVYAEWALALAVVGAFVTLAVSRTEGLELRLGGLPLLLLLLIGVCIVWQGRMPGLGYVVYLGLFLICHVQGAAARGGHMAVAVAGGLLVCALLQSLAGLLQLLELTLGGLVMQKMFLQAFGNVGQANHYANLVFLGLASLGFLYARRCLPGWLVLPLAFWLALAGAASASRGSLMYTAAFAVLGVLGVVRGGGEDGAGRRLGRALLLVVACSVVAQALVTYGQILDAFGVTTALDRAGDAGSNGQRLYNWQAAWETALAHPWIGQGPATFYKAAIDAMFTTAPASFPKFAEHAHNLPLNMAAELGFPLALLTLLGLAGWYLRHLCAALTAPRLWALACVAVGGLHSMVEYPLWYTYLMVPVALATGVADGEDRRLPLLRLPRVASLSVAALALAVLIWVAHDWYAVRSAFLTLAAEQTTANRQKARTQLADVSRYSLFSMHAQSLRLQSWRPVDGGAAAMADRCDAHWHFKPGWFMLMRCGEAFALAEREASLKRLAGAMCNGFPYHHTGLKQWAKDHDAAANEGLRIGGNECL